MTLVKFPVRKGYSAKASALAKKSNLKDLSDWERQRIRLLLQGPPNGSGLIAAMKAWEDLHEITDPRTVSKEHPEGKKVDFEFDETKALPIHNGKPKLTKEQELRALDLKERTLYWLSRGAAFNREVTKAFNEAKGLPKFMEGPEAKAKTVADFLSTYLQQEVWRSDLQQEYGEID